MQKDIDNNVYTVKSSETKVFYGQKRHKKTPRQSVKSHFRAVGDAFTHCLQA